MKNPPNYFKINIGFIAQQSVGFSRDFHFDMPQIQLDPDLIMSDLTGKVTISRTSEGLLAQMNIRASIGFACSRCLDDFSQLLEIDFTELFTFNSHKQPDTEFVLPDDGIIDFAPLAREYMLLELPINPICKPDCKGFCQECGNNLNEELCDHKSVPIDPRMEVLKKLLDDAE